MQSSIVLWILRTSCEITGMIIESRMTAMIFPMLIEFLAGASTDLSYKERGTIKKFNLSDLFIL
jgi:hypothetical protein